MSVEPPTSELATATAEEVLRLIYGDDYEGCTVSLEAVAQIITDGFQQEAARRHGLFDLYEKLVEALDRLSAPPAATEAMTPEELRSLLGERLDAIHELTTRTIEATAPLKAGRGNA